MKIKSKNLNWLAGRPVVILGSETAEKLNVHVNERVQLSVNSKKIFAVVDIFSGLIKKDEIGLSQEISEFLEARSGSLIDVRLAELYIGGQLIKKKMNGEKLTEKELRILVSEINSNNLTETEIAFFVSAERVKGMSMSEIIFLTKAMVSNGKRLDFDKKIVADKHCIGGIAGNRTTPIVVAICAAAGLTVPKNSSRAITSAAGTADVIETIANVRLAISDIKRVVNKTGACLVWGGSLGLAPSDDKIIHVERVLNLDVEPQLIASILSKKISSGSNRIIIDIPYGGGKIKTKQQARKLGNKFIEVASPFNIKLKIVYTDGREPIGNGIGPALEMIDVLSVLQNQEDCPKDLKKKSLYLASKLMSLCGISFSRIRARRILESGRAYAKFKEIINAQNRSEDFEKKIKKLRIANYSQSIISHQDGKITAISNERINSLCRILGTPETQSAGVYLYKHIGRVKKGEKILTLYSETKERLKDGMEFIHRNNPIIIE